MTNTGPTNPPQGGAPSNTQGTQGDPDDLGEAGRRAIAAERARADAAERDLRAARTELATAQGRITEHETTIAALTTERDASSGEALRYRIALDRGLPTALAGRLQGDDEAALTADADALLALMPPAAPPAGPPVPRADPSQGSRTPPPETPEAAFAAALGITP